MSAHPAKRQTIEVRPTAHIDKPQSLTATTTRSVTALTAIGLLDAARDKPKSPLRCVSHLDPTLGESRSLNDGTNRVETTYSDCGTFTGFGRIDRQRSKLTALIRSAD